MSLDMPQFTLRVEAELLRKFRYIAEFNARSTNREIETVMRKHVEEFEKAHGEIRLDTMSRAGRSTRPDGK